MRSAKDGTSHLTLRIALLSMVTLLSASQLAIAGIEFRSYQTHSHIALNIDPQTSTAVEKIERNGKLIGLRLRLSNVGSFSEDQSYLTGLKDTRTRLVRFGKTRGAEGEDVVYEFHFTAEAVASGVEYFDYMSKTPHQVQIDYWHNRIVKKEEPKPIEAAVQKVAPKKAPVKKLVISKPKKDEKIAGTEGPTCGIPMRKGQDAFIYYKTWHIPFDYKKFFALETPDGKYKYPSAVVKKNEQLGSRAKEVAHYRLALKLYNEKQFALVLRTLEFFGKAYPKSPLVGELEFLKLNTLIKLSKQLSTQAYDSQITDTMRRFILENSESEKSKATLRYLVQEMMTAGQHFKVLEYALMGSESKNYAKDDLSPWVFRLAVAECLYTLGEYDRAERAYQSVIDGNGDGPTAISVEAMFRIGEVYSARKFHERAAISFEYALKRYPKEINRFPTNVFNLAESYFKLERFEESRKYFEDFRKRFPNDFNTWAASMRLGELSQLTLKAEDRTKGNAIEQAYVDIVNNHPYSIGAELAEARLAQCHSNSHSDPKAEFFTEFFARKNMKNLENVLLEPLEVEVAYDLAEMRFNVNGKAYANNLKFVEIFREKYSKLPLGDVFRKLLNTSVNGYIIGLADEGKGAEVLRESENYADLAMNPAPIAYNLAIIKAAFQAGRIEILSNKVNDLSKLLDKATAGEKDEFHYYNAQLMKIKQVSAELRTAELEKIAGDGTLSAVKLDELADLALLKNEGKGDTGLQVRLDSQNIRSDLFKKLVKERQVAVFVRFLRGSLRLGNHPDVIKFADQAILRFGMETRFAKQMFAVRELRAEALYLSGEDDLAVKALAELLKADPNYSRRQEFEFDLAKSLVRIGKESEALEKFRELARSPQDSIWKKSAQAEIDQIEWENGLINNQSINQTDRRSK